MVPKRRCQHRSAARVRGSSSKVRCAIRTPLMQPATAQAPLTDDQCLATSVAAGQGFQLRSRANNRPGGNDDDADDERDPNSHFQFPSLVLLPLPGHHIYGTAGQDFIVVQAIFNSSATLTLTRLSRVFSHFKELPTRHPFSVLSRSFLALSASACAGIVSVA